jgi:ferric-dicitrate binding protein FerR (iron transport regulator)
MAITEQKFRQLLDRYLTGRASPDEVELLDRFFEAHQSDENHRHLSDLDAKQEMLQNIRARINEDVSDPRIFNYRKVLAIAAALLFLMGASYLLFYQDITFLPKNKVAEVPTLVHESTARGEKLTIELNDGTKVYLNSGSTLTYPKSFRGKTREVSLAGEAYFEVAHNAEKPFIVKTQNADTRVIGTSFNIKSFNGANSEITLVEGKVNVTSEGGNTTLLPNQQAVISSHTADITTNDVDVARFISWKENLLFFEETSLKDAAQILESWYNVEVELDGAALEQCKITAKYKDESLENVLKSFQFLLKINYTINNGDVKISGKGCK